MDTIPNHFKQFTTYFPKTHFIITLPSSVFKVEIVHQNLIQVTGRCGQTKCTNHILPYNKYNTSNVMSLNYLKENPRSSIS
jgi:hypothetical protein